MAAGLVVKNVLWVFGINILIFSIYITPNFLNVLILIIIIIFIINRSVIYIDTQHVRRLTIIIIYINIIYKSNLMK